MPKPNEMTNGKTLRHSDNLVVRSCSFRISPALGHMTI